MINKKIILASESPRRSMLLKRFVEDFQITPADIDETAENETEPTKIAQNIAAKKALNVAEKSETALIIGADTIVVLNGKVYGKPKTPENAVRYLKELAGKTHKVITGVHCIDKYENKTIAFAETTLVTFLPLDDATINAYVATGEPLDRAGAYAIQGIGSIIVEKIDGCYDNVVGLPIGKLARELKLFI